MPAPKWARTSRARGSSAGYDAGSLHASWDRAPRLLVEEPLDVGIATVGEGATRSHERVEASGGVARRAARRLDDVLQLLVAVLRDERGALQRAESRPDADRVQIVDDGFSEIRVRSVAVIIAGV